MLWPRSDFHIAYGQIKHAALQSGGSSVLVLVAQDVDGLCASNILTRLLRTDFISYTLVPVRGYSDIARVAETHLKNSEELRSVVFVNCGALVNLTRLLSPPPQVKLYVLDSHRPIHLTNIYDNDQQIVVFDDGAQNIDDFPADGSDIEEEEEEKDEDMSEDESESEDENDNDREDMNESSDEEEVDFSENLAEAVDKENQPPEADKSTENDTEIDAGMETEAQDEKATEDTEAASQEETAQVSNKEAKRKRRTELLEYYRGSFYGAPAASVAYELAQQMNGAHRDLLWFAMIGLTKQFILEQIDEDNYALLAQYFREELLAVDPPSQTATQSYTDEVTNPGYSHGRIAAEEDFRFMCHRHWSLYDSMYYSDYVASKLGLYQDHAHRLRIGTASDGDTSLHVLLARMGFSLRQSQQRFSYMPLTMKQKLKRQAEEIAPDFGLDDLLYDSFVRQLAFHFELSAADAVYGLQALLEAPASYISSIFQSQAHQNKHHDVAGAWDRFLSSAESSLTPDKAPNFYLAQNALTCHDVESAHLMESGVNVSMALKKAIVRVGVSVLERKLIVRVKHFRYVCLEVSDKDQELFASADVLTQLSLFLLNVHRGSGKWGGKTQEDGEERTISIVPLVLITWNPSQNCYLVVGITCPSTPGEVHRNTLGTAFRLAATEAGANFRQDGFTSSAMEIQTEDIQHFVEQLHNVLDA